MADDRNQGEGTAPVRAEETGADTTLLNDRADAAPNNDMAQVGLSDDFIHEIHELLAQNYTDRIQELCRPLAAPDVADLLAKLDREERHRLSEILGEDIPAETFPYLDREMLNDLLEHMPGTQVATIVGALGSDDAINLVSDLPEDRRAEIMRSLSRKVRAEVEEGLTFPEKSAGRLMQREFVAVPEFWTVGKTVDYMRAAAGALPDSFYDLFVVDPTHKLVGTVALSALLCARRDIRVETLMRKDRAAVAVDTPQDQVAHLFRRKDLLSAPVTDDAGRLVGVITVDDVVDVIHEEAGEDLLRLGGVTDSDVSRPVFSTVRARFLWLAVNLGTAFLDTAVISRFEGTIEKLVALAALMPVVASMGGNAGTQTLAVMVRALATREVTAANMWRVVIKEIVVGAANGILFGLIMIGIIVFWYHDLKLGLVMCAAMIFNLIAAGFSGALIPLALYRMKFDPAHSAVVFLTTVTDVVGFFAFLALAAGFLM
jgi:magnesium transporter